MTHHSSIEIPDNKRCAFCDYLSGVRPFTFVARTADIAILVTREQRGVPHLLVIPTRHTETIVSLDDEICAALMKGIREAARAIDSAYTRPGISVWQNNGVPANQTVGHVHFHVAGTLDGGDTERGAVPELPLERTEAIACRLRPHFARSRLAVSE